MKLPQSQSQLGQRDLFLLASLLPPNDGRQPKLLAGPLMPMGNQVLGNSVCTVGYAKGYEVGLAVPPSIGTQSVPIWLCSTACASVGLPGHKEATNLTWLAGPDLSCSDCLVAFSGETQRNIHPR